MSGAGSIPHESGRRAAIGVADWLCLAAAPTFAVMALLTWISESGRPDALCSAVQDGALSDMVLMYLLMSSFHSAPWLKLICGRAQRDPPVLT